MLSLENLSAASSILRWYPIQLSQFRLQDHTSRRSWQVDIGEGIGAMARLAVVWLLAAVSVVAAAQEEVDLRPLVREALAMAKVVGARVVPFPGEVTRAPAREVLKRPEAAAQGIMGLHPALNLLLFLAMDRLREEVRVLRAGAVGVVLFPT